MFFIKKNALKIETQKCLPFQGRYCFIPFLGAQVSQPDTFSSPRKQCTWAVDVNICELIKGILFFFYHLCVHACMCMYVHKHVHAMRVCLQANVCAVHGIYVCACMHGALQVSVCVCLCMCVCTHMCVCACVCVCVRETERERL